MDNQPAVPADVGRSATWYMKRKLQALTFRDVEREFGSFVYRPHYPFNTHRGCNLELQKALRDVFLWFLANLQSHSRWTYIEWNAERASFRQFHHRVFQTVYDESRNNGRLRLAVIVDRIDSLAPLEQDEYRMFSRRHCRSGFKSSLVLKPPEDFEFPDTPNGRAIPMFDDLLLVFVHSTSRLFFEANYGP